MERRKVVLLIGVIIAISALIAGVLYFFLSKKEEKNVKDPNKEVKEVVDDFESGEDLKYEEDIMFVADENILGDQVDSNYKKASKKQQQSFKLDNIKLTEEKNITKITGTIKNNYDKSVSVIVTIEFLEKGQITSSVNRRVDNLKANKKEPFEMSMGSDLVTEDYKIYVKYIEK